MKRLTKGDGNCAWAYKDGLPLEPNELSYADNRTRTIGELMRKLAAYEDAEEQGLWVRLPKNIKIVVARKKTESNAIINELIHAMCPYADDDRLFKAVDALRVFVAQQNDFIDTFSNSEAALAKEGDDG